MLHLEVHFDKIEDDSHWVTGSVGNGQYKFYAKVEDEPSNAGINKGRTVKLVVRKGEVNNDNITEDEFWKDVVANYDRGWTDKPVNSAAKEIFYAIFDELETIKSYNDRIYGGSKIKKALGKTKKAFGA
ncbi:hypothetical protein D3C81_1115030 [compost metagenome]